MRVFYVSTDPGVPVFGRKGCSIHVQEVIRAMRAKGADVTLFARSFGGDPPEDLCDLACIALPVVDEPDPVRREHALMAANHQLDDLLSARARPDLVYERYALWSDQAMAWARAKNVRRLLEVNAPLVEEQARHRGLYDRTMVEILSRSAFRAAEGLIAVSKGVGHYLNDQGVLPSRVHVIPNGVVVERFNPAPPSCSDKLTIGFVGTLKPWHGVDVLIEAARLAHQSGVPLGLLIVGDGPQAGALSQQIAQAGLAAHTEMTGAVQAEAIPALIARMHIACAPYPALEDFYFSPLKIMEYMAAGRAIIASDIGDIPDLLIDGQNALLAPPGEAGAIAKAIDRLWKAPQLRERLGREARLVAEHELGWDRVVERILGLARAAMLEDAA